MRKLYEIDQSIEDVLNSLTDPETGEIIETESLDALLLEREQKIESVVLYYKDVAAEIGAVGNEIVVLEERLKRLKKTSEGLKTYISKALEGQKFSTAKCDVSFRKSEAVEVDDEFVEWASDVDNFALHFIKRKITDTPDKAAIKQYLKDGGTLEHCHLVEKQNLTIK